MSMSRAHTQTHREKCGQPVFMNSCRNTAGTIITTKEIENGNNHKQLKMIIKKIVLIRLV